MSHPDDLVARVERLEARLRAAEDVQAIHRLKARYGQLVDARYGREGPLDRAQLEPLAREIAGLFTEDAVWDGGAGLGVAEGRAAIAERMLAPTLRFSWHYFLKPHIEVSGDRGHGSWDILSPCTAADGRPMWMAGVEDDEYARIDGEWLHRRMALRVVFMAPYERGWSKAKPKEER